MIRPVRKIAFVSPHCAIDFTNGAATATLDALVFLESLGFQCQVFCNTRSDSWEEDRMESVLAARGMPCLVRRAKIGPYRGRMIFTAYGSGTSTVKQNGWGFAELDETQAALTPCPSPGRRGKNEALAASPPCSPLSAAGKGDSPVFAGAKTGTVPVTLFNSASSRGWRDREEVAAFVTAGEIFLSANRPDLVWTYGGDPVSRRLQQIVRQLGIPLLFALHNFAYRDRTLFAATDRVIVPTEFARRFYREKLALECEVLPLVVDPERVKAKGGEHGAGSKEQGAGSREYEAGGSMAEAFSHTLPAHGPLLPAPGSPLPARYVTFVNPEPRKGVHVFARIAEVLSRRRPDIRLLLVEGAAKRSSLAALGVDLAGLGNLTIWPNTPDARKFHAVSKLLLMPSLMENAGFIAMEAMTNGIPVLASNRGGLPETIGGSPHHNPFPEGEGTNGCLSTEREEYVGGFLFDIPARYTPETRDVPTAAEVVPWIETIIRLWDDADYYEQCSRAALERAQAWHPDRLAPLYRNFFSRVSRRPEPPPVSCCAAG